MVMVKPVLPFVADFIGHAFFKAHHMATVHIENGKLHVHKEVIKNVKEETSDKNTSTHKKDTQQNEHIVVNTITNFCSTIINERMYNLMCTPDVPTGNHQCNYPPPRI
jgi:hypothetical protein